MPDKRTPAATAALAALTIVAPPTALGAQEAGPGTTSGAGAGGWLPARSSFVPLLAAPREVSLRGSFVLTDRDLPPGADFEGRNVEAGVGLGHRIPVLRLQEEGDGRPELTLGFEVGVFTRFHMETPEKDLVNADFRVGMPLSGRLGPWEARAAILHVSSHVGDDFDARFDVPFRQVTRDGFELTVARRLGGSLRVYGGGDLNFHVNPGVERTAARWGAEWDPGPPGVGAPTAGDAGSGGGASAGTGATLEAWPFAAADFQITRRNDRVASTAVAGVGLRVSGTVLRLEARGHSGPSPMGRFRDRDESYVGVGLRVVP